MAPKPIVSGKKKLQEKLQLDEQKPTHLDVSTSNTKTVLLLLDSPELAIVCKACNVLLAVMQNSESQIMEVVELGGVSRLMPLLNSLERAARCHAILCLNVMVQLAAVRTLLFKTDIFIPALLKLIHPEEELVTLEKASHMLAVLTDLKQIAYTLTEDYSFKVSLGRHHAHKPLLPLLQSTDPDVQKNCIKGLCQLMEDFHLRSSLLEDDGLPLVIDLLQSEYAIIQEFALKTLRSCMHHAPSRDAVSRGEDLPKLVAFLGDKKCSDLHVLAVEVLGLCLETSASMTLLQSSGNLQQLLAHIADSTDPLMKKNATNTLARAAKDSLNRKVLHESECEKIFIQFLSSEDIGMLEAACGMLGMMAALNSSQQRIGLEGGMAELVQHLSKDEDALRCAAIGCLARLVQGCPSNSKFLAEAGGLESLVLLVSDRLASCRQLAAECIISLSCDECNRQQLLSGGVVPALVGCLTFLDSVVQASAVRALGMLAIDQTARQQMCSSGGLQPLLELLHSSYKDVLRNALWTMSVCFQCTDVAEEAGRLGAIKLLQTIESSEGILCASLAQAALNKLLDANLPAKYWVTGVLDLTDIIVNIDFYDVGPALSKQNFMSWHKLAQRPFTKNQPILTVSLGNKHITVNEDRASIDTATSTFSLASGGHNLHSRSRQQQAATKSKLGKAEPECNGGVTEETELVVEEHQRRPTLINIMMEVDRGLNLHLKHVQKNIKPLPFITEQIEELAKYVAGHLGGVVERSGTFCYELNVSMLQVDKQSNFVPIGSLQQGSFQHRALLFKVLCDSVGVGCSLVRGNYARHWNEVCLKDESVSSGYQRYLVDLMFQPGALYQDHSIQATQYKHI